MLQDYWYMLLLLTVVSMLFSRGQGFGYLKCLMILSVSIIVFMIENRLVDIGLIDLQSAMLVYGTIVLFLPFVFNTVEWRSKNRH
ncbi:MAG: hypothetical protein K6L75_09990 [Cellvibrionaceae bacterium]